MATLYGLSIIINTSLSDVFIKRPKYHESISKSINWKYNFEILLDSVKDNGLNVGKLNVGKLT